MKISLVFTVEKLGVGQFDPDTPNEITGEFMDLYRITIAVPSINLIEICVENSSESLLEKIEQIAQNSLILNAYPDDFFPCRRKLKLDNSNPEQIYQDYSRLLLMITNDGTASGFSDFLTLYCRLSKNESFAKFMSTGIVTPKIQNICDSRHQISRFLEQQTELSVRIGFLAVSVFYTKKIWSHQLIVNKRRESESDLLIKIGQSISLLQIKFDLAQKEQNQQLEEIRAAAKNNIEDVKVGQRELRQDFARFTKEIRALAFSKTVTAPVKHKNLSALQAKPGANASTILEAFKMKTTGQTKPMPKRIKSGRQL